MSEQRQAVLDAVRKYGPISPLQVSDETSLGRAAVRKMLNRMDRDGKVGDAMSVGDGKYIIRGSEQRHSKPSYADKPTETKDNFVQTPVTSEVSQASEGSHSVTDTCDSVTPVTSDNHNHVTGSKPYDPRVSDQSVTSDKEISMSNSEKAKYFLKWLHGFGGKASLREAQQRCSPTLKGEDIRLVAPDLEKDSLIEIAEDGKLFTITDKGNITVNPQASLF